MSKYHDYDPDDMFPRRPEPKSLVDGKAIRWILIAVLAAFAIWIGAGCKSMPYLEDARVGLTGIDLRFHEPKFPIEEQGFFGVRTNRVNSVPANWGAPANWDGPVLMPMNGRK